MEGNVCPEIREVEVQATHTLAKVVWIDTAQRILYRCRFREIWNMVKISIKNCAQSCTEIGPVIRKARIAPVLAGLYAPIQSFV